MSRYSDSRYRGLLPRKSATPQERLDFHSMPEPNSGCTLWLGHDRGQGYGAIGHEGKTMQAHRLAWILRHGPIPDGLFVCHKCDVRACINPDHLFLGTNADNTADKVAKGRGVYPGAGRGEQIWAAKLTTAQVVAIRADERTQARIAEQYGVDPSAISNIKRRRNWRHVP